MSIQVLNKLFKPKTMEAATTKPVHFKQADLKHFRNIKAILQASKEAREDRDRQNAWVIATRSLSILIKAVKNNIIHPVSDSNETGSLVIRLAKTNLVFTEHNLPQVARRLLSMTQRGEIQPEGKEVVNFLKQYPNHHNDFGNIGLNPLWVWINGELFMFDQIKIREDLACNEYLDCLYLITDNSDWV